MRVLALSLIVLSLLSCGMIDKASRVIPEDAIRALAAATSELSVQGARVLARHEKPASIGFISAKYVKPKSDFDGIQLAHLLNRRMEEEAPIPSKSSEVIALEILDGYAAAILATSASVEESRYGKTIQRLASLASKLTGVALIESGVGAVLDGINALSSHGVVVESLRAQVEIKGIKAHPAEHLVRILILLAEKRVALIHHEYQTVLSLTQVGEQYTNDAEVMAARLELNLGIANKAAPFVAYIDMLEVAEVYLLDLIASSKKGREGLTSVRLLRNAIRLSERTGSLKDSLDGVNGVNLLRGIRNGQG